MPLGAALRVGESRRGAQECRWAVASGAGGRWLVAARRHFCLALARFTSARLCLALAAHAGRLVTLATTRLREDAVLLDFTGESLQRDLK